MFIPTHLPIMHRWNNRSITSTSLTSASFPACLSAVYLSMHLLRMVSVYSSVPSKFSLSPAPSANVTESSNSPKW